MIRLTLRLAAALCARRSRPRLRPPPNRPPSALTLKNIQFTPAAFEVPAGEKVRIVLTNQDPATEEFDSHDSGSSSWSLRTAGPAFRIGPLKPGAYVSWANSIRRRPGPGERGRAEAVTSNARRRLIVFREVLEAGLIVGIVLAATVGVRGRLRWIAAGLVAGLAGALLVAVFAQRLSDAFAGSGQDVSTPPSCCRCGHAGLARGLDVAPRPPN